MNASVSMLDLPEWLAWTSDALFVASLCLALLLIVLVGCIVAQIVTVEGRSNSPRMKDAPAPAIQVHHLLVRGTRAPAVRFLRRIRHIG
jgi:hypothetical protein